MRRAILFFLMLCAQGVVAPVLLAKNYLPLMEWQSSEQTKIAALSVASGVSAGTQHVPADIHTAALAVANQTSPAKLSTIRGDRAVNARLLKCVAWLAEAKAAGADPLQVIAEAQQLNGNRGLHGAMVRDALIRNLDIADKLGCLTKENIQLMKGGRSPQISRGPYAGQPLEVDHVVPVAVKPKLANEIANLELLPRVLNRQKGADFGPRQIAHARRFDQIAAAKQIRYVSLGAAIGLGFGPLLWNYANGEITTGRAMYQATRITALMGTGLGTDAILTSIKGGVLRGTFKGNLITGAAIFATETGFLLYENGGAKAFQEARFWEELGGSASALAVGIPVGIWATGLASETGPFAPVIGFVTGAAASGVAYVGGKSVMRPLLEKFAPEIARKAEKDAVTEIRASLAEMEKRTMASAENN